MTPNQEATPPWDAAQVNLTSVEDALGVAAMPEYGEYSLFEWAHNTLNVPAAYRELQERDRGR